MIKRLLNKFVLLLVVPPAVIYLGFGTLIWWQQDSLVFFPARGYRELPEAYGLKHEEVTLQVAGESVRGWFVSARGVPRATVLFLHGNGGNLSSNLTTIRRLAEAGFDSFSIDYEGYGESSGSPSEANAYRDTDAAWDWLTRTRGLDPKRIVIWGHSLGGGMATHCALTHPEVGALVLQNTFTSLPDMGARLYPWLPVRLITHNYFDNLARVKQIHTPVLIAHGKADSVVPYEMGKALFDAANEPKKFVELDGGHDDGFAQTPSAWNELTTLIGNAGVTPPQSDSPIRGLSK